jgi:hypothetical protein
LHRDLVVALAAQYRLPSVYPFRYYVTAGGLISYSTDLVDQSRQAASYVDRILRGASPTELPVQAPTKYVTTINLKTAKALGLTDPAVAPAAGGSGDRVMDRRAFLAGAATLLAAPFAAEAQQARSVWRLGFLAPGLSQDTSRSAVLIQTLQELGYVQNQSLLVERRFAEEGSSASRPWRPSSFNSRSM